MMHSAPDSFIACYEIPSKQKKPCKYAEEKHACESSDRILLHCFALIRVLVNGRIGPCFKAKLNDRCIVSEAKIKTEYQHLTSPCLYHARRIQQKASC